MTPISSLLGMSGPIPPFTASSGGGGGGGGGGSASFSWKYHMYGYNMGAFKIYWKTGNTGSISGGTLNELAFTADGSSVMGLSGEQQSQYGAWKDASADLASHVGTTGRIVFLYYKTPAGWRGDFAVDNMVLTINGSDTNLYETDANTSTLWWSTQSYGMSYSSVANAVADYEDGQTFSRVPNRDSYYNTTTFYKRDGETPSLDQNTGPTGSARSTTGAEYIFCETSNGQGLDDNSNRYCFLVSNEFTLS